ncbi:MAG: GGDEF domain-containing protein [Xanthomonadales bacterium]|nr:GGDEF domain-containing protein [Xanthomonadales bacterium]
MELMLWRWSTMVQATSVVLIAGFFIALAHSLGRDELRSWVGAWLANLAALLVTIVFWLLRPEGVFAFGVATTAYLFSKTMFVVLLIDGAAGFSIRRPARPSYAGVLAVVAMLSLSGGLVIRTIDQLGLVQAAVICLGLGASAISLARSHFDRHGWLATGFAIRALLALAESAAYAMHWNGANNPAPAFLATFISVHSSFDAGAEWVIALGCVLTLYSRIQGELTQSNTELKHAQVQLRDLLHRDQLTDALNRRALPSLLREAHAGGATLLFFDLDDFKRINDQLGHHVGDTCLFRFAGALRAVFAAHDRIVRYAGDEFVVFTQEGDADIIAERIRRVRSDLASASGPTPSIHFSVGIAHVDPGDDPEAALLKADRAMYAAKSARVPEMRSKYQREARADLSG